MSLLSVNKGWANFQECRSHLKIQDAKRVTWISFHTEALQILGTTIENFVAWMTWCLGFVCLWCKPCLIQEQYSFLYFVFIRHWTCNLKVSHSSKYCCFTGHCLQVIFFAKLLTRLTQIPSASSPRWLDFVLWCLIFVGPFLAPWIWRWLVRFVEHLWAATFDTLHDTYLWHYCKLTFFVQLNKFHKHTETEYLCVISNG